MPGKRITRHQEKLYMNKRQLGHSQTSAAAQSAISERSGRRIENGQRSSTTQPRHWRTREDPFDAIWEKDLAPLLDKEPTLTGLTLWEYLEDHYPDAYPYSLLRTLQRRVKHWRATQGPTQPVIFRQTAEAGRQGLSDFTHPRSVITIKNVVFSHLLYQFRFAYSGWRYVQVVLGGESYSALAEGLQAALHLAGGSPLEHRTDSLTAAYNNRAEQETLAVAYEGLCQHYQIQPTRNNLGVSHENGAIECAHGSFKHRLEQALKLRGSNDFDSVSAYQAFLNQITKRLNKRCQTRFQQEQQVLRPLPADRFMDYSELSIKVTRSSTIDIKRVLYSVPSRLIGETIKVHVHHDRLELFVGQTLAETLPRIYAGKSPNRARRIDYRHLIHSLACKPQAFRFLQFRDDLLPNDHYRQLWQHCDQQFQPQEACKWIVGVLRIAMEQDCETALGLELVAKLEQPQGLPSLKTLQSRYLGLQAVPILVERQHPLSEYDNDYLSGQWCQTPPSASLAVMEASHA